MRASAVPRGARLRLSGGLGCGSCARFRVEVLRAGIDTARGLPLTRSSRVKQVPPGVTFQCRGVIYILEFVHHRDPITVQIGQSFAQCARYRPGYRSERIDKMRPSVQTDQPITAIRGRTEHRIMIAQPSECERDILRQNSGNIAAYDDDRAGRQPPGRLGHSLAEIATTLRQNASPARPTSTAVRRHGKPSDPTAIPRSTPQQPSIPSDAARCGGRNPRLP